MENWARSKRATAAVAVALLVAGGCARTTQVVEEPPPAPPQPTAPPPQVQSYRSVTTMDRGVDWERPATRAKSAPAPQAPPPRSGALEPAPEEPVPLDAGIRDLGRIQFGFDDHTLSTDARDVLRGNAEYLEFRWEAKVRIEGHCDERGTTEYNLALGDRRAQVARGYLQDLGIDPQRLEPVSFGRDRPLVGEHNEQAWAQNRRAEFVELAP